MRIARQRSGRKLHLMRVIRENNVEHLRDWTMRNILRETLKCIIFVQNVDYGNVVAI